MLVVLLATVDVKYAQIFETQDVNSAKEFAVRICPSSFSSKHNNTEICVTFLHLYFAIKSLRIIGPRVQASNTARELMFLQLKQQPLSLQ